MEVHFLYIVKWLQKLKRQLKFTLSLDNYKTARERAKKAVESSNVDTEEEVLKERKKKVPSKYWTESEGKHTRLLFVMHYSAVYV